jgi:predicted ATP-grasp superfamily ATP-dependent carboligase
MDYKTMKNSKNKTFSVLVPDAESWLSYSVQNCLAYIPGIKMIALSKNTWDPMRFSRRTHQFLSYAESSTNEGKLFAIQDAINRTHPDIVLPVDTQAIRLLSVHRESLQKLAALAPTPPVKAIDMASNKWLLAKWLQEHHIPCPATLLYQPGQAFEQALSKLVFPVLLKPTQQLGDVGIGGRGIEVFNCPDALLQFCHNNTEIEYIVQSYVNGYDMDCSVLCRDGKIQACTIQKGFMAGSGRFDPPAGIDLLYSAEVYDMIETIIKKMNWSGVAHFDLRYDADYHQVKVIEINVRFWGSLFGSFYAGVNFPYLTCLAGLGYDVPQTEFQPLRYVNGEATLTMCYQRLLKKSTYGAFFDRSALEFMAKDPVPKLAGYCFKTYGRLKSACGDSARNSELRNVKNRL